MTRQGVAPREVLVNAVTVAIAPVNGAFKRL